MRFEFQRIDSLPRHAWCARIARGAQAVAVRCGPWVETRDDRFFEGVWDGDFAGGRFDEALSFVGTGCVAGASEVSFAGSMNLSDWMYAVHTGDDLVISNSLVFALVESDDAPDPAYPYYYGDMLAIFQAGVSRPERAWLPTRRGRRVFLHSGAGVRLRVRPDLSAARELRPEPAPPDRFGAYVEMLEQTLARAIANAADAKRIQRYRPVAAVSRGYDSPAVAVVAARAGVREAVTFANAKGAGDADDGTAIGERLGYTVTAVSHQAYRHLPGMPEAEAALCDWGFNAPYAAMERQLEGTLLLSGSHGDIVWRTRPVFTQVRHPTATNTGGGSMRELNLRAGCIHMPVPYILSRDPRPLRGISLSDEMRPWSLGGDYDRPIPRRLAEEAGIPREWFGRNKANASDLPFRRLDLERPAHRELRAFVASVPKSRVRAWKHRVMRRAYAVDAWATARAERVLNQLGADVLLAPALHPRWKRSIHPEFWAFHWGFEKIRDRYVVA
jgi:hypothetical protein